jgi:uncharacterized protein (TIGR02145 family)
MNYKYIFKAVAVSAVAAFFSIGCGGDNGGDDNGGGGGGGNPSDTKGTFTDSRDQTVYKKVTIGGKTWMAENLNYDVEGSKCYNNSADSCAKYGRLYNWEDAKSACPSGWRLPSTVDWNELTDFVGGSINAGKKLKSISGWLYNGGDVFNGTDDYGFAALPGGRGRSDGGFRAVEEYGYWWSSSELDANYAWSWRMYFSDTLVGSSNQDKTDLFSVRCVAD